MVVQVVSHSPQVLQRFVILLLLMAIIRVTTGAAHNHNQTTSNTTTAATPNSHPQVEVEKYVRNPSSSTVWIIGALFLMTVVVKTVPTLIIYLVYGTPPKMTHDDQDDDDADGDCDGLDQITMRHRASKRKMSLSATGRRGSSNSNAAAEFTKL